MEKYNCPRCNAEFTVGTKFCPNCGCNLEAEFILKPVCPKCNRAFPSGTKFCDIDGVKLVAIEKMTPRCVRCGAEYSADVKYCPKDGGAVISEASKAAASAAGAFYSPPIAGKYPKASLGNRFLASLLDGLIGLGFGIPAIILYVIGIVKLDSYNSDDAIPFFVLAVLFYIFPLLYNLLRDGLGNGQSWGKKALNLMVVHLPDKKPCTFGQSALRNLIMFLLGIIPFVGWLIEPIIVLAAEDGRRLGDKAANTQVIESRNFNQ
jgi:uncharacterized RDD family membrane protein YckC